MTVQSLRAIALAQITPEFMGTLDNETQRVVRQARAIEIKQRSVASRMFARPYFEHGFRALVEQDKYLFAPGELESKAFLQRK